MAWKYLRSTGGSDSNGGTSWADAKATMASAIAAAAAGDRIAVRNDHSESTAASTTLTFPGTVTAPNVVTCVSDSGEPPTTLSTGAAVATSGNTLIYLRGSFVMHGVTITAGSTSNPIIYQSDDSGSAYQVYESCVFVLGGTGGGASINIAREGGSSGKRIVWKNCTATLAGTGQRIILRSCDWEWNGGTVSGTTPTAIFDLNNGVGRGLVGAVRNVDFSPYSASVNICDGAGAGASLLIEKCKLPSSWSGALIRSGTENVAGTIAMLDCMSGSTKIRYLRQEAAGVVRDDTAIYRDGGAEDEGTAFSFKMTTTANAAYPTALLQSPPIVVDNQTTGSAITLYAEIVHDSATALTDADVWAVADYLGTASSDLGSSVTTRCALLASASSVASSSETWTGTGGMSNPNKQRIAITFTPQVAGDVLVRVYLAKASKTIYLCGAVHA